jgi:hypothetical protein
MLWKDFDEVLAWSCTLTPIILDIVCNSGFPAKGPLLLKGIGIFEDVIVC